MPPRPDRVAADPPRWAATRALSRAVVFVGVLAVAAIAFGRFDLVVVAAPVAFGTVVSLCRRARAVPEIEVEVAEATATEGAGLAAAVALRAPAGAAGYDLAVVRIATSSGLRLHHGDRPYLALGDGPTGGGDRAGGGCDVLDLEGEARRWGHAAVGPAVARAVACDGLLVSGTVESGVVPVKVYPATEPFHADEAMPRAAGMVGQHRSRLPGEGGELSGVRPFGPGDRLRRIDWRVTLRTRQPHIVATLSDRDAEVVVLLDLLHDAGRSEGYGAASSVLDTTVRATAAIADHYLHVGDRVSLLEYGRMARWLRPASGHRQYLTVLEWLLEVAAEGCPYDPVGFLRGMARLPGNALVVVLSPLLDRRSAEMLARLARSGRYVVAVDTLHGVDVTGARPTVGRGAWTATAHRLWRLERENTIGELRESGVPVVEWAGAGSLDAVLRDVSRLGAAPRAVRR